MASTIDYIDCPHCNAKDAFIDTDRWSEHIFCKMCGYSKQTFVTNLDEAGKEGWIPEVETMVENNPLGAYYVEYTEGTADVGTLHKEDSEEFLMKEIEVHRDSIVRASIRKYIDGEHTITHIIGNEEEN